MRDSGGPRQQQDDRTNNGFRRLSTADVRTPTLNGPPDDAVHDAAPECSASNDRLKYRLDVHALDRTESGPKPELVQALGAQYHSGTVAKVGFEPDIIIESTVTGPVIADCIQAVASGGIVCLTGVGAGGPKSGLTPADVATSMVLKNNVFVGSVNANKRHWYKGNEALARADRSW
jgi:threonine dehydrogenase-like Zn-dependent dehydrogenase